MQHFLCFCTPPFLRPSYTGSWGRGCLAQKGSLRMAMQQLPGTPSDQTDPHPHLAKCFSAEPVGIPIFWNTPDFLHANLLLLLHRQAVQGGVQQAGVPLTEVVTNIPGISLTLRLWVCILSSSRTSCGLTVSRWRLKVKKVILKWKCLSRSLLSFTSLPSTWSLKPGRGNGGLKAGPLFSEGSTFSFCWQVRSFPERDGCKLSPVPKPCNHVNKAQHLAV